MAIRYESKDSEVVGLVLRQMGGLVHHIIFLGLKEQEAGKGPRTESKTKK